MSFLHQQYLLFLNADARRSTCLRYQLRRAKHFEKPGPKLSPSARLAQIRQATAAYRSLLHTDPVLPDPGDPICKLLSLRETGRLVQELEAAIDIAFKELTTVRGRLKNEEDELTGAKSINFELRERVNTLEEQSNEAGDEGSQRGQRRNPALRARELKRKYQLEKDRYERKSIETSKALVSFIDEYLASMVAAEDIGGPSVGDHVGVNDTTLQAGYTATGKEKKPKDPKPNARQSADNTKQRRIDAMIGDEDRDTIAHEDMNPRQAAARDLRQLIDRLVNASATSSPYVMLDNEFAGSRFLVRARIAQFHPNDSRRIRLIDAAKKFD